MRLKTKLVLSATGLTFVVVLVLSSLFVGELLRQIIEETSGSNDVLAREVVLITRQAVETGLRANPPVDRSEESLGIAVNGSLRDSQALTDVMNAIVRYSPTVEHVSVTDARGKTLVSTDPDAPGHNIGQRLTLESLREESVLYLIKQVFGRPQVLDTTQSLDRNGAPFLIVHVGVWSTFLRNSIEPWLQAALLFAMVAAALLANLALRPLEVISSKLEKLTRAAGETDVPDEKKQDAGDTVVRVTKTIDLLGEQLRTKEAGYTALQANLNQMLDTLRDGVLLFTADRRAVMVSDAVAYFLNPVIEAENGGSGMVGKQLEEIFLPSSRLGDAVLAAFESGEQASVSQVTLEDGRQVQVS